MKYKSRSEKLRNAIEDEFARKVPSVDGMVEVVEKYEITNLKIIDKLQRKKKVYVKRINGALKQCINSHGPINKNLIGSCSKRIYGSLIEVEKENFKKIKLKYFLLGILTCILISTLIKYI